MSPTCPNRSDRLRPDENISLRMPSSSSIATLLLAANREHPVP